MSAVGESVFRSTVVTAVEDRRPAHIMCRGSRRHLRGVVVSRPITRRATFFRRSPGHKGAQLMLRRALRATRSQGRIALFAKAVWAGGHLLCDLSLRDTRKPLHARLLVSLGSYKTNPTDRLVVSALPGLGARPYLARSRSLTRRLRPLGDKIDRLTGVVRVAVERYVSKPCELPQRPSDIGRCHWGLRLSSDGNRSFAGTPSSSTLLLRKRGLNRARC